jgi:DUF4097 and DUF4098 domain-containing protein YvlB
MKPYRILLAIAALLVAGSAGAANVAVTERFSQDFTLDVGGSFWIDNPIGNVEIIGTEQPGLTVTIQKSTTGIDQVALKEGRDQTQVVLGGDARTRVIKTVLPPRTDRWNSNVSYSIRVPRTVHVRIDSHTSDRIHVVNIAGNVTIKNVNGVIALERLTGATVVQSINGNIVADYASRPSASAQLSTVNGMVEVHVPSDSSFEWLADTLRGDFLTSLPVRGHFVGSQFRGSINSPGGPTIATATMTGRVFMLRAGTTQAQARSVAQIRANEKAPVPPLPRGPQVLRVPLIQGNWAYSTNIGSVVIGEIRGDARIDTGAGEVELGSVLGSCTVDSLGGPLNLGDIFGRLSARTAAGDIVIRAAREGGIISTGGGIVRLLYTGGPTSLHSSGGDVIVRQASGPITADTRSGDITINIDPNAKTLKLDAKTTRGNVLINVSARFGADVDATVLTSDPDANTIHSDIKGLTIRREQVGNKTRIHATGKINGGGERVELYAEEGDITISAQTVNPITVMTTR